MSLSYGQLRWRYFGGCGVLVGVGFFLLFGGGLLLVAYFLETDQEKWAKEGQVTSATVFDKGTRRERSGKSYRTVHWVKYSYQGPKGEPLKGEGKLPSEEWEAVQKKQTIQIEYLRSNPAESRCVTDHNKDSWGVWIAGGLGVLLTLGGLVFGMMAFVSANKKARLIFEGSPVLGTVTEMESVERWRKRHRSVEYTLHYAFTGDNGERYEGTVPQLNAKLVQNWHEGDPILVVHDFNDPTNHLPDIYEARREDLDRLAPAAESE